MGDRALIVFTDKKGKEVSPTVYLHWGGDSVPQLIQKTADFMTGRFNDVSYGCARFIGLAHVEMDVTNLSLGVWSTDEDLQKAIKEYMQHDQYLNPDETKASAMKVLAEASHGDAGLFLVNTETYSWECFGGYHSTVTLL